MAVCAGVKRDGGRGTATVEPQQQYCWWHDPAHAGKRRRAASRGGRSRSGGELPDLKKRIKDLAAAVLDGTADRGRAAVANQLYNTLIRAIEQERKEGTGARGVGRAPGGPRGGSERKEAGVSRNGLHRHYDRLEAEERFRLDVLAMARGDMQESERLVGSCPRFSYTMNDRGFGGRWHGAIEITLRVYIPLGEQLAKLQLVDAFREMVPYSQTLLSNIAFDAYYTGHKSGSYHAWNYAGKTGHPPAWPKGEDPEEIWEPDEDERDPAMERDEAELEVVVEEFGGFLPEVLNRLERTCVSQAFSIWSGYAAFCEESAGVNADKLAAVVLEPVIERIEDMKLRAERLGIEADEDLVQEMREKLEETWRMVEARGV